MDLDELFGGFNNEAATSNGASNKTRANGASSGNKPNQKKRPTEGISSTSPASKKLKHPVTIMPSSRPKEVDDTKLSKSIRMLEASEPVPVVADEFAQEFSKEYAVAESTTGQGAASSSGTLKQPSVNGVSSTGALSQSSLQAPSSQPQTLKISASVRHQVALPPDWPNFFRIPIQEAPSPLTILQP